jgi:hypothetical protein
MLWLTITNGVKIVVLTVVRIIKKGWL